MGLLDDLPADQRAVLQMVLQRGRSYDEIAAVLSIDRAAVRQRALDACHALTVDSVEAGPESALVTDYLLGQLPSQVADQVYTYLEAADADREWAHAVAAALAPLSPKPETEVPVGAPERADEPQAPHEDRHPASHEDRAAYEEDAYPSSPQHMALEPAAAAASAARPPASPRRTHRTRLNPAPIVAAVVTIVAVGVVVLVLAGNGPSPSKPTTTNHNPPVTTTETRPPTTTTNATTSTSTTSGPNLLEALNLTSPVGATQTVGVVDVVRTDGVIGIVVAAQGVPANSAHNAYAIWLYNSPTSYKFVGFIPNLVGKSGKFASEGELPPHASRYRQLLITLETQDKPKRPGEVVLSGAFRE